MQCPKCDAKNAQKNKFCSECGAKLQPEADAAAQAKSEKVETEAVEGTVVDAKEAPRATTPPADKKSEGYGTAAIVCGIAGLCFAWIPVLGLALGGIGLALGLINRQKNEKVKPGVIVSAAAMGLSVLAFLFYLLIVIFSGSYGLQLLQEYQNQYNTNGTSPSSSSQLYNYTPSET